MEEPDPLSAQAARRSSGLFSWQLTSRDSLNNNGDKRLDGVFEEIVSLVESSERQFGVANCGYCEYIVDRLELCITTCSKIKSYCTLLLSKLLQCLYSMVNKWDDYNSAVQYPLPISRSIDQTFGRGRPSFNISKQILVFLVSLS